MRAGVATSRHLDPERACVDAAQQAMLQAGKEGAPDLLWCVSVGHSLRHTESALAMARERSGAREAVAVTAASVFAGPPSVEVEQEPAMGVMALYGDQALTVWSGRTRRPDWKQQPMAVLTDPEATVSTSLRGLREVWDETRVAGGAAANMEGEAGVIHHGVGVVEHAAIGVGAAVCEVVVAQGCAPVGGSMVVTRADGNLVMELDGRRALSAVLAQLTPEERRDPARALGRMMVGVRETDAPGAETMCVRPLVGVAPDIGALAIGEAVRAGTRLTLVRRDAAFAERGLRTAVATLKQSLAGSAPVAALYFSCTGRGSAMYGRDNVESELLTRALGRVPMLGMASAYELGPHALGGAGMHLYSGVLMVLAEGN